MAYTTFPEQVRPTLQEIVLDMAIHFLSFGAEEVDDGISHALADLGEFSGVDRAYVFQLTSPTEMSNSHEWCRPGIAPMIGELQGIPVDSYPWFWSHVRDQQRVHVHDLDDLPPEAAEDIKGLDAQGVRSVAAVPMVEDGRVAGFIGFDAVRAPKRWSSDDLDILGSVSDMFVHALRHQRDQIRMEQLARSKDEFVAAVSHEVRTPLTAVVGLAAEMRDRLDHLLPREVTEFASTIAEQGGEVANIIEDLLVVARADIGEVDLVVHEIDLFAELRRVIKEFPHPDIDSVEIADATEVAARADPFRVRQIIRNLLGNALRHGGGRVWARAAMRHGLPLVEVCDDGEGIPEEERGRIFDAYHTLPGERSQRASIGLGLTVARRLARAMGGDVTYAASSRSCFELVLPAA